MRNQKLLLSEKVWDWYVFHKQTIRELCSLFHLDKKTVHRYLKDFVVAEKIHNPRPVHLVVDATYFGKRNDGTSWGVLLFRDQHAKENLWWKYITNESGNDYLEGRVELERLGDTILSVTCDGFKANTSVFKKYPLQICLFHLKRMVERGTTKNPQTEPGKVLYAMVQDLPTISKQLFTERLQKFYARYHVFLNEKTVHPDGSSSYTHQGVRSGFRALQYWYNYMFTFHTDNNIPTTTNSCDGHFSHVKDVLRIHRGLSKAMKQKVIDAIFLEGTIAPKGK